MASTSAARTDAAPAPVPATTRPPELADPLNHYLYHPLAKRLALLLLPTGISPNAVSAVSGILVVAAGLAYAGLPWPVSVAAGLFLHLAWHVVDGADGDLARLKGVSSPLGELVDGIADYAGHFILYVIMALILAPWLGIWAYVIPTLSGFSRIAQSNHVESQRRIYLWRVYGVPWLRQAEASGDDLFKARGPIAAIVVQGAARGYLKLAGATNPHSAEIDSAFARADARERRRLTRLCRQAARRGLALQLILGANPRTLLLGISMALGSPLYYFLVEGILLNLLLAVSIVRQRRSNAAIVARLRPASAASYG